MVFAVRTRVQLACWTAAARLSLQSAVRCRSDWMEESSRRADSEESSSSSDEEGPRRVADMPDVDSEPAAAEETPADSITPDEREVSLTKIILVELGAMDGCMWNLINRGVVRTQPGHSMGTLYVCENFCAKCRSNKE